MIQTVLVTRMFRPAFTVAMVAQNLKREMVGIEYTSQRWIEEKYPDTKIAMQELTAYPKSKRNYDVITFETSAGEKIKHGFGFLVVLIVF